MRRRGTKCDSETYPRLINCAHMLDNLGFPVGYYGNSVILQFSPT